MHEAALVARLIRHAESVAAAEGAVRVTAVELQQGRMGHVSPDQLQRQLDVAARGTLLDGATLRISEVGGGDELRLVAVTVEDD